MSFSSSPSILDCAVQRKHLLHKANGAAKWSLANLVVAAFILYELKSHFLWNCYSTHYFASHFLFTGWVIILTIIIIILVTNCLLNFRLYFWPLLGESDIILTKAQMNLLHIDPDDEKGFKLSPSCKDRKSNLLKSSTPIVQQHSLTPMSPWSPNEKSMGSGGGTSIDSSSNILWTTSSFYKPSVNALSCVYKSDNDSTTQLCSPDNSTKIGSFRLSNASPLSSKAICNSNALEKYLKSDAVKEKKNMDLNSVKLSASFSDQFNTSGGNSSSPSFWKQTSPSNSPVIQNYSPLLSNHVYQVSTYILGGGNEGDHNNFVESKSPTAICREETDICCRLAIPHHRLVLWLQNLRMWICQTVLVRVVNQIDSVNKFLTKHGMGDVQVGTTGLDRLRMCSQLLDDTGSDLSSLLPFLDLSHNQEYLVLRLRELSAGGAMSVYRWNSGSALVGGVAWSDKLPTDAEVVMHCLTSYLDSRLPPSAGMDAGRPFSSFYVIRGSNKSDFVKSKLKTSCVISQSVTRPPNYGLLFSEQSKMEVGTGRNNLFYTLLLFLHYYKTKEFGMLGRVNMGPSGINMLWIISNQDDALKGDRK